MPRRSRVKQPRPKEKVCQRSIGPIKEPNENDVLCGRGSKSTNYPGNIQYREIVNQMKPKYLAEPEKLKKKFIAAEIVERIRSMNPPGRFLKEDAKNGGPFYDIGDKEAFKKAGQALREGAPEFRQHMEWKTENNADTKTAATLDAGTATTSVPDAKANATRAVLDKQGNATTAVPEKTLNSVQDRKTSATTAVLDSKTHATTVPDRKSNASTAGPNGKPNAVMEGQQRKTNGKVEGRDKNPKNATNMDAKKQQGSSFMKRLIGSSSSKQGLTRGATKRVASDTSSYRATHPPHPGATHTTKNHLQNSTSHGNKMDRFSQNPQQPPFNPERCNNIMNGKFAWQYLVDTPTDGKGSGWRCFDSKTSDGLEKEYIKGRTLCHMSSGYVKYEINFKSLQQRNLNTCETRSIRRWNKNSQRVNNASKVERFSGAVAGGKKNCQQSEMASQLMSQNKQMGIEDISFNQFDATFSETSSITAASLLSGPSTDSRRRGAAAMREDPNEPLPVQLHPALGCNAIAAQQQQRVPTTQRQVTAPEDLIHTAEDIISSQDEMTFDSCNSKTWCQIGHGFITGQQQQQLPTSQQEAAHSNSIYGIQEDMIDSKDAMTLDTFDSQMDRDMDHNFIAEQQQPEYTMHKEVESDNFVRAAQDEVTLYSIDSRIWGDENSIASQQQQAEPPSSQKVASNDLISIPEDVVAARDEMATGRVKARMWDALHVQSETLYPSEYSFTENYKDGDASLCSAMSISVLSSRMGTISITSSRGSL